MDHTEQPADTAASTKTGWGDAPKATPKQRFRSGPPPDTASVAGAMVAFDFGGATIRTVHRDGEAWFVAVDVCAVLEQPNSRQAVARLDDDQRAVHNMDTPGGRQDVNVINESGLYALILTSRKPQAKVFRRWVTGDVLPAIRKTGRYTASPESEPAAMREVGERAGDGRIHLSLPGPGRYVATILPDGGTHVQVTEYEAMFDAISVNECRLLCHHIKIIECLWSQNQIHRSMGLDPKEDGVVTRLDFAVLGAAQLAQTYLGSYSHQHKPVVTRAGTSS